MHYGYFLLTGVISLTIAACLREICSTSLENAQARLLERDPESCFPRLPSDGC